MAVGVSDFQLGADEGTPESFFSVLVVGFFAFGAFVVFLNLAINCCLKCDRKTPVGAMILFSGLIFALVRVAEYMVLYKLLRSEPRLEWLKGEKYLEEIGLFLILATIVAMWAATARAKGARKSSKLPRAVTALQIVLTLLLLAGFACWIASKVEGFDEFVDFDTIQEYEFPTWFYSIKLQKAGAVLYAVVMAIVLFASAHLLVRTAAVAGVGIMLMGIFMAAKVYFIIWYLFSSAGRERANDEKLSWPLNVLTEVLTLYILAFPCFVRRALRRADTALLPVTDANPHAPQYDAPPAQYVAPLAAK